MHEAEILCDRIIILNRGSVVGSGAPKELIEREAPGYVGIFERDDEPALLAQRDPRWEFFQLGSQCCVRASRFEDLLALQVRTGRQALQLRPSNLEDVYLKLTGRDLA